MLQELTTVLERYKTEGFSEELANDFRETECLLNCKECSLDKIIDNFILSTVEIPEEFRNISHISGIAGNLVYKMKREVEEQYNVKLIEICNDKATVPVISDFHIFYKKIQEEWSKRRRRFKETGVREKAPDESVEEIKRQKWYADFIKVRGKLLYSENHFCKVSQKDLVCKLYAIKEMDQINLVIIFQKMKEVNDRDICFDYNISSERLQLLADNIGKLI